MDWGHVGAVGWGGPIVIKSQTNCRSFSAKAYSSVAFSSPGKLRIISFVWWWFFLLLRRHIKAVMKLFQPSGSSGVEGLGGESFMCSDKEALCQITRNHPDAMGQAGHRGHKALRNTIFFFRKLLFGHRVNQTSSSLAEKNPSCEISKCRQFEADWVGFLKGGTKETRVISSSSPFAGIRCQS